MNNTAWNFQVIYFKEIFGHFINALSSGEYGATALIKWVINLLY